MSTKFWVYISGPYTKPDPVDNTRKAIDIAEHVLESGHIPIIPHLSMFWHFQHPHAWQEWIDYDLELIRRCDIVLRMPGESKGADMEVEHARLLGIPVVTNWLEYMKETA